ncbi:hypothetical protein ASD97_21795 [Streptomyces sp. Root63]|uniref:DUF5682 family protein n=1 Tax=Streptomyces TaxID=1883 RepID=UPI0006F76EBA|nr:MULTISPECIES: DUF5682 family protein [unclassified Streptomyces]KQX36382.1 hypothetical protein ASD29_03725 [Streptomyces sp. Root1295]KRA36808.1 hypothetical protein ASD97_21795 [Streptomyces sp. Root63]
MTSPAGTATGAGTASTAGTAATTGGAATTGEAARTGTAGPGRRAASGPWLLGVRHHGPGSARAVLAALAAARPAAVLIEGPPEGDALLPLAADPRMRPPVALLAHAVDDPGRASFWPMAAFSPEWVAIRWALDHDVPVRFIDLPAAHSLALKEPAPGAGSEETAGARAGEEITPVVDPIRVLAETAGYDDPERWWEDVVEHRSPGGPAETGRGAAAGRNTGTGRNTGGGQGSDAGGPPGAAPDAGGAGGGSDAGDALAPFVALAEAMGALREAYGDGGQPRDAVREAYMRIQLRNARKEFGNDVAVVCGAWHVPALAARTTLAADRALLKGLPKVRTDLTWVPWTHRRLARHSGYGAGIDSPGWYGHLFDVADRPIERWMTKVAGLLREEDRFVSTAHVIEAVRLAETLAALRGRPLAGLGETTDAVRAVMCEGSDVPLALVRDRLIVGETLGEVPDTAPAVPLQRDLTRSQRTLRLKPEASERELDLDLRKETDAARSRLLHRLRLLDVGWGDPVAGRGSTGTFRESWRLSWEPELHVRVAEAGVWGTTVVTAATAKAESGAVAATALADVTALAEHCLLAGLPDALPVVMKALADRAALDADVGHLADALPALARSLRYGDVRSTDTAALAEVAAGLAERICVGLPPACTGLDADGAEALRRQVEAVHGAIGLLLAGTAPVGGLRERWDAVLHKLAARDTVAGIIRGRATRLLLDEGRLAEDEAARLMGLALSPGTPPADAAAWIEGFVGGASGGGMLLVHDERLLGLVDAWLTGVPAEMFTDVLPLLRRTFSAYEPGVRRTLGELVRRGPVPEGARRDDVGRVPGGFGPGLDRARADAVEPVLRLLIGRRSAPEGAAG